MSEAKRDYSFGDWVVYADREIGRVASVEGDAAFVCYSHGCTAAKTPLRLIEPYIPQAHGHLRKDPLIGFHRFDDSCPEYDPDVCEICSWKFG